MLQALIRAGEGAEVFHSCLPCTYPTVLLLATVDMFFSFMDTGQRGEQSVFTLVLHIFNALFISHRVVSNGVFSHYSNPFCTTTFINMGLMLSRCTEW